VLAAPQRRLGVLLARFAALGSATIFIGVVTLALGLGALRFVRKDIGV
jgi:hypothetical protein